MGNHESENLLDLDQSNLKLSASKRAKIENYNNNSQHKKDSGSEGILTKFFESPLGMIRRMWSGFGPQQSANQGSPSSQNKAMGKSSDEQTKAAQLNRNKSFHSAETMASSSSDRKSDAQHNLLRSTKQFKADLVG